MMRRLGLLLHRRAAEKIFFFVFFGAIFGPFGIIALHLQALVGGELRQMTNEADQLPAIFLRAMTAAKRGHACEAHAVLDDPEKLAIGKLLRLLGAQVRRLGIEALADRGIAGSFVAVADGAMIGEMQARVAKIVRRGWDRILLLAGTGGNGHVANVAREHGFEGCWCGAGTEAVVQ